MRAIMKNDNGSSSHRPKGPILAGLLMGITASATVSTAGAAPDESPAPATKPTVEELLKRIEILEHKLDEQQKQNAAAASPAKPAPGSTQSGAPPQAGAAPQSGAPPAPAPGSKAP